MQCCLSSFYKKMKRNNFELKYLPLMSIHFYKWFWKYFCHSAVDIVESQFSNHSTASSSDQNLLFDRGNQEKDIGCKCKQIFSCCFGAHDVKKNDATFLLFFSIVKKTCGKQNVYNSALIVSQSCKGDVSSTT